MKFQLLLLAVALFAVLAFVESRPVNRRYCFVDGECDIPLEYCRRPMGDCNGEGYCAPRRTNCPTTGNPVCSCTGETFANECSASESGLTVSYEGACTN